MKIKGKSIFIYDVYFPTVITTMLRPSHQEGQVILHEAFYIEPSIAFTEYRDIYQNICQRATLPLGEAKIVTEVTAEISLTNAIPYIKPEFVPIHELPPDVLHFILPSRYCQSDLYEINQLVVQITANLKPGYDQVEAIRSWIYNNIMYQYGISNSSTSAYDIMHSRTGVCRDFTHLAIALCRNLCFPSRMAVGYLDQLTIMDLHAWFEVYIGGKWHVFDAVQNQTSGNRLKIAHGRDAADVAMVTEYGNASLRSLYVTVEILADV